ncbi:MAG: hypothetical protein DM484_19230 [Candidatus Methylumidiphilus alinenensis]|uniref:Uncharacterized protein n=1 Tax=Candidatus Methylumidiphilus alinenensis TaxID=2202197 RepID=A0A2W4QVY9_9GAMM|nr:MAG: hypothetical protein DM484_19230 [Candidatus Methylumidiphilus alinenensis]
MALNVAPLRESKKSFLNGTVKQYGEEAKRKFHATAQRRNDATTQRKRLNPSDKTNIQRLRIW